MSLKSTAILFLNEKQLIIRHVRRVVFQDILTKLNVIFYFNQV